MNSANEARGAPRPASAPSLHGDDAGEASGLIDVRKLAAIPRPPSEPRLDALLSLVRTPAAPPVLPRRATRPAQAPLYVLMGLLSFGVVGLAAASLRGSTPAPGRIVFVSETPEARVPEFVPLASASPEAPAPAPEAAADPQPAEPPRASTRAPRTPRPRDSSRKPEPARPGPASAPAPASDPPRGSPDEVRCLLDPGLCRRPAAAAEPAEPAPSAPALPETLSLSDISEGIRPAKSAATATCAALSRGGEVVRLKISIAGPRGVVLGASVEDDAGNPELARCCADAMTKATFRPVQKVQLGAAATLKF